MKKRILSALLAVVMVMLLLPIQAFAATEEIKGGYVGQKFETVIDTVLGAKTFAKSGNIPEGLTLSGTWAYKNTYGDYVFKMTLSGIPTKAGTYNFSVTYKKEDGTVAEKVDYTMTIGEKAPFDYVESIRVKKWPDKTVYYLGDTVDLTGMQVIAVVYTYNATEKVYKASEYDVTDLVWVEPAVFTSDEAQDVKVYLKAPKDAEGNIGVFESHFRVSFEYMNPKDVARIEVYQKPEKLTYTVGETLDTTGMTVRLHKGDGSAEDITEGFTTDVTTLETVGTQTVTVSYGEGEKVKTATFDVTVNEKVEAPASSASSSSEPEPVVSSQPEPESEPEVSSEPEVESEPEVSSEPEVESEPEVSSEPEAPVESEPEEIEVIGGDVEEEPSDNGNAIPFWVWIIIGLLVILIAAAVALFFIGRKRIDD